jgi:hypothetical protein
LLLQVNNRLEIAQNSHDVKVLEAIKLFFDCGYLKPKYDINSIEESKKVRSVSRYVTLNNETIINFFDKYPLKTLKRLDYLD